MLASSVCTPSNSLRLAAVRPAAASTRLAASSRVHSAATSWTRRGTPRLACSRRIDDTISAASPGVEQRDLTHGLGIERLDDERRLPRQRRQRTVVLGRREKQDRDLGKRQLRECLADGAARPIEVVDHQQRRPLRLLRLRDNRQGDRSRAAARHVQHRPLVGMHLARELRGEASLSHPTDPDERHGRSGPAKPRALPQLAESSLVGRSPDQRSSGGGLELGRQAGRR